ncbi:hypothetical protein LO763_11735 [Glycomyces sp. A-F 0318]|uniref:hypothetical protein n=1 Tax=Glycomyces amatae TaxID=2881355 RepID=UPI001E4D35A6|nr:hypothetical protein [Glycomyces amatae]MCD0444293.1 hypothetical protein [Glycomyces amatae]
MPHMWEPGDKCKIRPIYTLPASTRSHWKVRSSYYCTATVQHLQRSRRHTTVFVELDQHERLPLAGVDRLQAASLFELHTATCRCRRCRKAPSDWRAEGWPTRVKRACFAIARGIGRAIAWTWRLLWRPRAAAASSD